MLFARYFQDRKSGVAQLLMLRIIATDPERSAGVTIGLQLAWQTCLRRRQFAPAPVVDLGSQSQCTQQSKARRETPGFIEEPATAYFGVADFLTWNSNGL